MRWIYAFISILLIPVAAFTEETDLSQLVKIEIVQEEKTIQPGRPFWVAIQLDVKPEWHTYWKNPGDAGVATSIEWELPNQFVASPMIWPTPKRFKLDEMIGFGYEGKTTFLVQILPPSTLVTAPLELKANVRWLVCSDSSCIPGETPLSLKVVMKESAPEIDEKVQPIFTQTRSQLPNKTQIFEAYLKQDEIRMPLNLLMTEGSHLISVDFFPEDSEVVDYSTEVALIDSSEEGKAKTLILKSHPSIDTNHLKGIVIAKDDKGITHSLEIAASLVNLDNNSMISMVANSDVNLASTGSSSEQGFDGGILMALAFAFTGGIILNLMPCVLPVISFKILSFVKMASQKRLTIFKHGIAFSSGVVISFWILAAAILLLRVYGQSVGWGFQLQEPLFVGILAAILLILSLSLFGIFELGTSMISLAGKVETQDTLKGSFISGVLATAVATPCTGPFLGSAIGYAMTAPAYAAFSIFTSLGLGMSLPYLLLSAFPVLLKFIPRPGPWMSTFKEMMGFLMLASVLWLIWVFGAQTNALALSLLLASFLIFALGAWIYGKWGAPVRSKLSRYISYALMMICVGLGGYGLMVSAQPWTAAAQETLSETSQNDWEPFSSERIADLQAQGIPVLVDFTAKWCLICQVNHLVLSQNDVSAKFDQLGVVKMKADWTKNDPKITEELRKHGRSGVPLYVLYTGKIKEMPQILPQVLTPEIVLQYLETL